MKKLLTFAVVALAGLFAQADDYILNWMVDEDAADEAASGWSYAQIYAGDGTVYKAADLETGEKTSDASTFGSGDTFASAWLGSGSSFSYYVELFSDSDAVLARSTVAIILASSEYLYSGAANESRKALSVGGFAAVPEPTSSLLVLIGMSLLALKRKVA